MKTVGWVAGVFGAAALVSAYVALAQRAGEVPPQVELGPPGAPPQEPPYPMNFFITSVGIGDGGNLGGLAGADAHCQKLATAVGRGNITWHAYLSTQGPGAINARDRIGKGPFYNAKGQRVGDSVEQIHGDTLEDARRGVAFGRVYSLNEKGEQVGGIGDPVVKHNLMTGTNFDGRAFPEDGEDHTCANYTNNGTRETPPQINGSRKGSVQLAHFDKQGGATPQWNSSHPSVGCDNRSLGGWGLFYCFAAD